MWCYFTDDLCHFKPSLTSFYDSFMSVEFRPGSMFKEKMSHSSKVSRDGY